VTKHFDSKLSARSRQYEYLIPISVFKKPNEKSDCSEEFETKLLEKINNMAKKFFGTKNFHNYSKKMKAVNPQSKRHIYEFGAKLLKLEELMTPERISSYKPEEVKDLNYLLFNIKGQSFIYHQIRKMIGMLIQCIQMDIPEVFIDNSFSNNVVNVWLSPAQGLFLNRVQFLLK